LISAQHITEHDLHAAVAALRRGELVAMPTETVYGLAGDARNEQAVLQIFARKGRPADHPLIVHLPDASALDAWAHAPNALARALAATFWPGPLTLVLHKAPHVSPLLTGGQDSVGLRVPNHPVAQALLRAFGGALAAPSANRFGRISPTRAAHVREEFGEHLLVLDGGASAIGIESTIVDARGDRPIILRPGHISAQQIQAVAEQLPTSMDAAAAAFAKPRVSGALQSHYAPRTPTRLLRSWPQVIPNDVLLLALTELPSGARGLVIPAEPELYAHQLYDALRQLDQQTAREIWVQAPPEDSALWQAIWDRLGRAVAP
jgi:L-threonylcarbamoyladenylate synthase